MKFADFYQKYQQLKNSLPQLPTHNLRCINCDYGDYNYSGKDCYFCFDNSYFENCLYCFDGHKIKNCLDCDYCVESELLYQSVDCYKCYNSTYLNYCARMYDSHFCWDCGDSHDLFGCTHLKHKQYCIFNKQYGKEEYHKRVKELLKRPAEENLKKLEKLIKLYPFTQTNVTHSENCDYCNHVHYAKNCYLCFDAARNEDCSYLYDSAQNKNCYDFTQSFLSELSYECNDSARLYNCFFMDYCSDCYDSGFCYNCENLHNCFGCAGLKKKEYCFLNKQLTEKEYQKEVQEVMEDFRQSAPDI